MRTHGTAARILRLVRPWWKSVAAATVCMAIFAMLSGVTLGMLLPLFDDVLVPAGERSGDMNLRVALEQYCSVPASELGSSIVSLDSQGVGESWRELVDGISRALEESDPSQILFAVIVLMVVIVVLKNLFGFLQTFLMARVEQGVIARVRNTLYSHLLELDMRFYTSTRSGDVIARFTSDVAGMNRSMRQILMRVPREMVLLAVYLTVALWASWRLALATLLIFPPVMFVILIIGRILKRKTHYAQRRLSDFSSLLQETIFGIRVVKAFSMEEFEGEKFRRIISEHRKTRISLRRIGALASPLTEAMGAVASGLIMWYGGRAVLAGESLSAGRFLVFLAAILSMMKPIKVLSNANAVIQGGFASAERVFELMDRPVKIKQSDDPKPLKSVSEGIEFHDVCFRYTEGIEVLRNISFTIGKGEIVALVGPSGGGKSTIADMIPRFYDPDSGSVTIDGVDLRDIAVKDIRRSLGVVTQETVLFNDTVTNNIAYGVSDIPFERIRKAAEAANALEFIEELSDGFETVIGERGCWLSGGQKQRLAIARAILKNPEILIFDEATSALDTHSERYVQRAIDNLIKGRTTLVIAHRLSTISKATKVIYVENGMIAEQGTHEELLEKKGKYRGLYDMQFKDA